MPSSTDEVLERSTRFNAVCERAVDQAHNGWTLDQIDERIIEPSELSDEHKAAAWLVARAAVEVARNAHQQARRLTLRERIARTGLRVIGTE